MKTRIKNDILPNDGNNDDKELKTRNGDDMILNLISFTLNMP